MPFPQGWKHRCKITIDHTKVIADQTDFPVYLAWTGAAGTSNLVSIIFDADGPYAAKSDGSDIRFTTDKAGTTQIAFDIVTFSTNNDPANARAEIHVNVPAVSSAVDTVFYIWFRNPAATAYAAADTYGRNNTWTNGYVHVHHMQTTAGTEPDVTGNGHDGTVVGCPTRNATGKLVGNAYDFAGANQHLALDADTIGINNARSLEVWMQPDSFGEGNLGRVMDNATVAFSGSRFHLTSSNNTVRYICSTGTAGANNAIAPNGSNWYHWVATRSNTNIANHYVNGAQSGAANQNDGPFSAGESPTWIGDAHTDTRCFDGRLDEVRLLDRVVPLAEVTTKYNNQNSPNTFASCSECTPIVRSFIPLFELG